MRQSLFGKCSPEAAKNCGKPEPLRNTRLSQMHNPLAPFGNIRYLVRNSDTILYQHDAAHGSDSPLRS